MQEVAKAEMKTRLYRSIRWRKRSSREHCIRIWRGTLSVYCHYWHNGRNSVYNGSGLT